MNKQLTDLITQLNLTVKNEHLIQNAFVHRSYLNESKEFEMSNERLEYLGDAVLELATSHYLYNTYPDFQEGMLTNMRAALVRTESLGDTATELGFPKLLLMSKGEEATGGRSNRSILADTFEAFLGAIYLDQGYEPCVKLLSEHLFTKADNVLKTATYKDNKSLLQEIAQSRYKATPMYNLISESGPDHDKEFVMQVEIAGTLYGEGKGKSKQTSQEDAAKNTLEMITHS
ncbi:ribonuclease III [Candidatus Woesebacteria bacterium]|nr:ribonuclease III [Candidatus Woesebacteria bacterium]